LYRLTRLRILRNFQTSTADGLAAASITGSGRRAFRQ
jgi:hypothetical protein